MSLSTLCVLLQAIGLVFLMSVGLKVWKLHEGFIIVWGIACVVGFFLPNHQAPLEFVVAIGGMGLIVLGCIKLSARNPSIMKNIVDGKKE